MNIDEQRLYDDLSKKREALIAFMKGRMGFQWEQQQAKPPQEQPQFGVDGWDEWRRLMIDLEEAETAYHNFLRFRFDELGKENSI
jgi:hypothetical protein